MSWDSNWKSFRPWLGCCHASPVYLNHLQILVTILLDTVSFYRPLSLSVVLRFYETPHAKFVPNFSYNHSHYNFKDFVLYLFQKSWAKCAYSFLDMLNSISLCFNINTELPNYIYRFKRIKIKQYFFLPVHIYTEVF